MRASSGSRSSLALLASLLLRLVLCGCTASTIVATTATACGDININANNEGKIAALFSNCTTATSLVIDFTAQLQNIDALAGLTSITPGPISVTRNVQLASLVLPQMISFGSSLLIKNNAALVQVNLTGTSSSPQQSSSITVDSCPLLARLALPQLQSVSELNLVSLPALREVSVASLRSIGTLSLTNSLPFLSSSSSSPSSAATAFASVAQLGGVVLTNTGVRSLELAGLRSAAGQNGDGSLLSVPDVRILNEANLVNFTGLALTSIGQLYVSGCPALRSLSGSASRLVRLDSLKLSSLPSFESLDGLSLETLSTLSGGIELRDLPSLDTLVGLEDVQSAAYVTLASLPSLRNLEGLLSLTRLTASSCSCSDGTALSIERCDRLTNLRGLDALTEVAGAVRVHHNAALSSLDGLQGLIYATSFSSNNNSALTSIAAGLSSLRFVKNVSIRENQVCCPSAAFFEQTGIALSSVTCSLCVEFGAGVSPSVAPITGGAVISVPFTGGIPTRALVSRFRANINNNGASAGTAAPIPSQCSVDEAAGMLHCTLPDFSSIVASQDDVALFSASLELLTESGRWLATNRSVTLVPFADWARVDGQDGPLNSTSVFSSSALPGIPSKLSNSAHAETMSHVVMGSIAAFAMLAVLLGAVALCTPSLRASIAPRLAHLDRLFVNRKRVTERGSEGHGTHSTSLFVRLGEMSAEGGLLTIASTIIVVALLAAYTAQLSLDNTLVLMSNDPRAAAAGDSAEGGVVASTYSASLTLSPVRFFGASEDCHDWFDFSDAAVTGFSHPGAFECHRGGRGATGRLDDAQDQDDHENEETEEEEAEEADSVTVSWSCVDCVQNLASNGEDSGRILMRVLALNACTSKLVWRFSSTDYLGGRSTVQGVMTAAKGTYFRGSSAAPSVVHLTATPTDFVCHNHATVKSGTLMKVSSVRPGSQVSAERFGAQGSGLAFEFQVKPDPQRLVVQLQVKQTPIVILAVCLAIIGGVFSAFRVALAAYFCLCRRGGKGEESSGSDSLRHVLLDDNLLDDGQASSAAETNAKISLHAIPANSSRTQQVQRNG